MQLPEVAERVGERVWILQLLAVCHRLFEQRHGAGGVAGVAEQLGQAGEGGDEGAAVPGRPRGGRGSDEMQPGILGPRRSACLCGLPQELVELLRVGVHEWAS